MARRKRRYADAGSGSGIPSIFGPGRPFRRVRVKKHKACRKVKKVCFKVKRGTKRCHKVRSHLRTTFLGALGL